MDLTDQQHFERLNQHTQGIIGSNAPRKLIVAGPGAGKTTSFRKLLDAKKYPADKVLTLTFLGNLRHELEKDLGHASAVFTFHGYCHHLLRKHPELRGGLSDEFEYLPRVDTLIDEDWWVIQDNETPDFKQAFRSNETSEITAFYLERANYYNTISFDDSVFRVFRAFQELGLPAGLEYDLVLIDEFQDFNRLAAEFVRILAERSPIVIVGDDDQALYEDMRLADPAFIRALYNDPSFENHELPYCTRCTSAVIENTNEFVKQCERRGILKDRIPKKFEFCPPIKRNDSEQYPFVEVVKTSIQTNKANYFGRYIADEINAIPETDIVESRENGFLTALIISSNPYRRQVEDYLVGAGFDLQQGPSEYEEVTVDLALRRLQRNPISNLWWRWMLFFEKPKGWKEAVKQSVSGTRLVELLDGVFKEETMSRAMQVKELAVADDQKVAVEGQKPVIKIVTFEGSKGLSAAHVFVVGMQDGTLPRDRNTILPIEAKKFLVALTRTRKHCHILYSTHIGGNKASRSIFLDWLNGEMKREVYVDKKYFS